MPRWLTASGMLALLAPAAGACTRATGAGDADAAAVSPTPAKNDDPDVNPSREVLLQEQKRMQGGEDVGAHLRAPRVVVSADQVVVNGHTLLARAALPTSSVDRVEAVRSRLRAYREHWLQIDPGQTFDGVADVDVYPSISAASAVSVLVSVAQSGFGRATVRSGKAHFAARWNVAVTPLALPEAVGSALQLASDSSGYHLIFEGLNGTDRDVPTLGGVDAAATAMCAAITPCVDMVVVATNADGAFEDVAMEAAALLASSAFVGDTPKLDFELPGHTPAIAARRIDAAAPPANIDGGAMLKGRVRAGLATVTGQLAADAIDRVVRSNLDAFRLCYAEGLRDNRDLQGRVTAKFVIDANGVVAMMADGGSDLPHAGVVECVVQAFGRLSFPPPQAGTVTVSYPLIFNPP